MDEFIQLIREHAYWLTIVYAVVFAVDIWLVTTGRESISERIWELTFKHLVVIVPGFALGIFVAWLEWESFWLAVIQLFLTWHLFGHVLDVGNVMSAVSGTEQD